MQDHREIGASTVAHKIAHTGPAVAAMTGACYIAHNGATVGANRVKSYVCTIIRYNNGIFSGTGSCHHNPVLLNLCFAAGAYQHHMTMYDGCQAQSGVPPYRKKPEYITLYPSCPAGNLWKFDRNPQACVKPPWGCHFPPFRIWNNRSGTYPAFAPLAFASSHGLHEDPVCVYTCSHVTSTALYNNLKQIIDI